MLYRPSTSHVRLNTKGLTWLLLVAGSWFICGLVFWIAAVAVRGGVL